MSENLRFQVVEEAFKKRAIDVPTPKERPSEYFGKYVFTRQKMYKYLPADVYEKLIDVIDNGARLDRSIAPFAVVKERFAERIFERSSWRVRYCYAYCHTARQF